MEFKIFAISAQYGEDANEELNKFMRSHKVIDIDKEFVGGDKGYWSFCISYISGGKSASNRERKEKKDYRKLLDEKTFGVFEQLRKYRKEIAKNDAVPAFAVFTDAELVDIAKLPELTRTNMQQIKGIGEKRLAKYGVSILKMYQDETSRKPD